MYQLQYWGIFLFPPAAGCGDADPEGKREDDLQDINGKGCGLVIFRENAKEDEAAADVEDDQDRRVKNPEAGSAEAAASLCFAEDRGRRGGVVGPEEVAVLKSQIGSSEDKAEDEQAVTKPGHAFGGGHAGNENQDEHDADQQGVPDGGLPFLVVLLQDADELFHGGGFFSSGWRMVI